METAAGIARRISNISQYTVTAEEYQRAVCECRIEVCRRIGCEPNEAGNSGTAAIGHCAGRVVGVEQIDIGLAWKVRVDSDAEEPSIPKIIDLAGYVHKVWAKERSVLKDTYAPIFLSDK